MNTIDLDYRPASYFRPRPLTAHLVSKVKNAEARRYLEDLLEAGELREAEAYLADLGLLEAMAKEMASIDPEFMGGNYLPDTVADEIEIARIRIASTTFDVTCVYASMAEGQIRYRVVDEYGGDTLRGTTEMTSPRPLTLGELYAFFIGAWPLMGVLEMNFDDDVEGMLEFFSADSDYYPSFDALCRERVMEAYG